MNYCSKHAVKMQWVVHMFDWFCRFKEGRSKTKVMLLAFFDSEGIIHHEYTPDAQTINKEFYLEVL